MQPIPTPVLKKALQPALRRNAALASASVAGALALVFGGYAIAAYAHPALIIIGCVMAGSGLWGCWTIAHDCVHGAFSASPRVNELTGNLILIPTFFPYYTTKSLHLEHHRHLNNAYKDRAWRPWPVQTVKDSDPLVRKLYLMSRSVLWWMGPMLFLIFEHFKASNSYPREQRKSLRSFAVIAGYAAFVTTIALLLPNSGRLFLAIAASHMVFSAIFALLTLMQHTSGADKEDVSWHDQDSPGALDPIGHTIDLAFPALLEPIFWNGNVHSPHHIEPKVPFYNLRFSRKLLMAHSGVAGSIKIRSFRFAELNKIITERQMFDPEHSQLVAATK